MRFTVFGTYLFETDNKLLLCHTQMTPGRLVCFRLHLPQPAFFLLGICPHQEFQCMISRKGLVSSCPVEVSQLLLLALLAYGMLRRTVSNVCCQRHIQRRIILGFLHHHS
jgi:hypothetical protein